MIKSRLFNHQGSNRSDTFRELIPNIEVVKKTKNEFLFDKQLREKRDHEMFYLGDYHYINNWYDFCWEFTFMFGSALLVLMDFILKGEEERKELKLPDILS